MGNCCDVNIGDICSQLDCDVKETEKGIQVEITPKDSKKTESLKALAKGCNDFCGCWPTSRYREVDFVESRIGVCCENGFPKCAMVDRATAKCVVIRSVDREDWAGLRNHRD